MPTSSARPAEFTLAINEAGWRAACQRHGLFGDTAIAAYLGLTYTTLYRVRTGRLAPGPKFIAHATMRLGNYNELFTPVESAAA